MRPRRSDEFCEEYGLKCPILLAPMAGACPPGLSAAVASAGGMGAMGALMTPAEGIHAWAEEFRRQCSGPFQLNLWIPEAEAVRDAEHEAKVRKWLERWGPPVAER